MVRHMARLHQRWRFLVSFQRCHIILHQSFRFIFTCQRWMWASEAQHCEVPFADEYIEIAVEKSREHIESGYAVVDISGTLYVYGTE